MNQPGFVFLISFGRSGSTLVQHFLNHLPGVLVRGENGALLHHFWGARQALAKTLDTFGGMQTTKLHPWFGVEQIDLKTADKAIIDAFTKIALRPCGDERWIGFKEIRYGLGLYPTEPHFFAYCDWLLTWPNARLIFLTRNVNNAASSGFWKKHDRTTVVNELSEVSTRFARYAELRPQKTRHLVYEGFCESETSAIEIATFLGVGGGEKAWRSAINVKLDHAVA